MAKFNLSVDLVNKDGDTPYMVAKRSKYSEIMDILVSTGNASLWKANMTHINTSNDNTEGDDACYSEATYCKDLVAVSRQGKQSPWKIKCTVGNEKTSLEKGNRLKDYQLQTKTSEANKFRVPQAGYFQQIKENGVSIAVPTSTIDNTMKQHLLDAQVIDLSPLYMNRNTRKERASKM